MYAQESTQEAIELKDESISAAVLKIVVDSIYGGDLHVNDENVFYVLLAADHLQVTSVVEQCCHKGFMQTNPRSSQFESSKILWPINFIHICMKDGVWIVIGHDSPPPPPPLPLYQKKKKRKTT